MISAEERRFVNCCVRRERRRRLLYELETPARRRQGLSRFCHQAGDLLEPGKIVLAGAGLERQAEFRRRWADQPETCLLLSPDACPEGRRLEPEEALKWALDCFDAVLILGGDLALVFGEAEPGGRAKYLLRMDGRHDK